jgi:hypothetical protein
MDGIEKKERSDEARAAQAKCKSFLYSDLIKFQFFSSAFLKARKRRSSLVSSSPLDDGAIKSLYMNQGAGGVYELCVHTESPL